jgi:sterol desaturase/sphingolipid hydroxylase (fatty acid hydroxylase superfamily)
MHHRYPRSHFSLYMTHWDRLCGTEHPKYRGEVAEHFKEAAHCKAPPGEQEGVVKQQQEKQEKRQQRRKVPLGAAAALAAA